MADKVQWEYRVETVGSFWSGLKDAQMIEILNSWGEEGWEVIQAHNLQNSEKIRLIARRPLQRTTRPRRSWPV
jgi:hypothetical protein